MPAQLSVITGPLKGTTLEIDGSVSVGRDKANTLRIKQLSVSRRHCLIEREADRFKLIDTSSYGTFVNHIPVREHYLEHGDEIALGDSLLVFTRDEHGGDADLNTTKLDQIDVVTLSAIHLRPRDVLGQRPGHRADEPRLTREMSALLKVSALIGNDRDRQTLYRHLLDSALEYIPAQGGAILSVAKGETEYAVRVGRARDGAGFEPMHVSRSLIEQTIREGVAMLSHEVAEPRRRGPDAEPGGPASYSVLCAPLADGDESSEVVYLLAEHDGPPFEEKHLEMLTAIAVVASIALRHFSRSESLEAENSRLRDALIKHDMVGESPAMREIYQLIAKVAPTASTVLILGESGTGKELAAYAIHANSPRADKPFVAVNCAAINENLLESELFGHERGAFTGAYAQKKGKLELADGGTFFLDEMGEMNLALQAKLLRVVQKRVFERVGGQRTIAVDVRLIAATNRDLSAAVRQGSFRDDLYYRLSVVELLMPPLRERRADIPLLANYFAAKHGRKCNKRVLGISQEAQNHLVSYSWPGNVRELENAIERAVVLGSTEFICPEDLPHNVTRAPGGRLAQRLSFKEAIRQKKVELVRDALDEANNSVAEAARLLGMHAPNLHRLIRTLALKIKLKD